MSKINKAKYMRYDIKKGRKSCLDINMRGFLCSCNNREKECVSEAYNILNKYADQQNKQDDAPPVLLDDEIEEKDVQDDLLNELASLKSEKKSKPFQLVESGAKNFLFIKTTLDNPVELALKIVSDIYETKSQQTKFLIRLVPVEITCKAYIKDIENTFRTLAEKHFKQEAKTFSIAYNHRNNNNLQRDDVIKTIANVITQVRPDNKVDLKSAELVVIVEVIKGIGLLSVIPDYLKYKKFNLLALTEGTSEGCTTQSTESGDGSLKETVYIEEVTKDSN